ncbi:MAG: carbon storage regulator CsrA [Planctomycetota bacterium]
MLVLSRQRDETIMIGDDIGITVVDVRGDKVRLGITAPPHIAVHRKEVYDAIKRERGQRPSDGESDGGPVKSLAGRKHPPRRGEERTEGGGDSEEPGADS